MTGHFVLTPRAQADLDEIWDYTADRWSLDQAETYTRQLWKDIAIVADRPSLGRDCTEVRRGYRMYPSGSHVLFYRQTASTSYASCTSVWTTNVTSRDRQRITSGAERFSLELNQ